MISVEDEVSVEVESPLGIEMSREKSTFLDYGPGGLETPTQESGDFRFSDFLRAGTWVLA